MNAQRALACATAALALIAAPAWAQEPGGQTTTTTTTTQTTTTNYDNDNDYTNEWIASGFVGSNFGVSAQKAAIDFGGSLSYLHNGAFGAEFLAGFSPTLKLNRLGGLDSEVYTYMANLIAAIPIGTYSRVHPFVSGGIGAMTLSLNNNSGLGISRSGNAVFSPDQTQFAGNIGAGIMAFGPSHWGIRADVRYFGGLGGTSNSTILTSTTGPIPVAYGVPGDALRKSSFWRANVGLALRW